MSAISEKGKDMETKKTLALFETFLGWLVPQQGAWRDATLNDVAIALSVASGDLTMTVKLLGHEFVVVNYWAGHEAALRASVAVREAGFPEVAAELEELVRLFKESMEDWQA